MEWQLIETAPLDGTHVLVAEADEQFVAEARFVDHDGNWWAAHNDPTDHWGGPLFPTHWMPLPAPPVKP